MKNKYLNIIGIIIVFITVLLAFFLTKGKVMTIGIKMENMDLAVNPGNDFYDYATSGWRKNNPLPNDYTRYGSFEMLDEENNKRVRDIVENADGKVGLLYKIAMDADKLNSDGIKPVKPYLDEIDAIKSKDELAKYLGKAHAFSGAFWDTGVLQDDKDSIHYILVIAQGGIGLSRDYYFDDDEKSKQIRKKYKEYIKNQMDNFGENVDVEKLYALEERMAKSFYKKEKLRNPLENYHKKSFDELKNDLPGFDWDTYFQARGINVQYINLEQVEPIMESIAIMNDTDLDLIKTYLKYRIINGATAFLDDKTYDIAFDFYNRELSGQKEQKPRWKRAVAMIDGSLGEMVGQLYVKKYFPESAKKRMEDLVKNLQKSLGNRIESLDWMSADTKKQAIAKLNTFRAKIGYPDKWRDYSAYYDPSNNEICFPAGILQYPFFDMDADDAFNYGAIGSVIGHEMTHGFDDSGRHFDKDGNMKDWWGENDAKLFEKHANIMKEHFNNILVAPNTHANGEFTLGENLADYGGVTVAYDAYKKYGKESETINGLTPDQRFFIAYAMTEASNITNEALLRQTKTNEHSLGRWRVNGVLPHVNAWYDVFNIKSDDELYLIPEKRVNLW